MHILEAFFPDEHQDTSHAIDFYKWYEKGYRGVIFDVDNTLVPHGADADEKCVQLFERLREIGFRTILLSNNGKERVERFNRSIGSAYIYKAGKPLAKNYLRGMEELGTDVSNTLFVGDQLFTDVWGAKRLGIYTILVKPINPIEEIQIVLKRYPERLVLYFYERGRKKRRKK